MTDSQFTLLNIEKIHLPDGLLGLPEWKHFKLQQTLDMVPVALLHCEEEPRVSFIVADPISWFAQYKAEVTPEDLKFLKAKSKEELYILSIVNVEADPFLVTANLLSPILINPTSKLGKQIVLHGSPYLAKQPLTLRTVAIRLEEGLLGLPEWKNFCLQIVNELLPIKLLVCLDEKRISFPVVDPSLLDENYKPKLSTEDKKFLGGGAAKDMEYLVILNVHDDPFKITANMKAPIAINNKTGRVRQVILSATDYQPNYPLKTMDLSAEVLKGIS